MNTKFFFSKVFYQGQPWSKAIMFSSAPVFDADPISNLIKRDNDCPDVLFFFRTMASGLYDNRDGDIQLHNFMNFPPSLSKICSSTVIILSP